MMTARRRAAALALGAALLPGLAAAQSAGEFVEVFRTGCLAHLPDFAGSAEAFAGLGFTARGASFRRQQGPAMLAEIYDRTVDSGRGCVLAAETAEDAAVLAAVEAAVNEVATGQVRRRDAERDSRRVEAFSWQAAGHEVLVVVLPRVGGMRALNVTVGGR